MMTMKLRAIARRSSGLLHARRRACACTWGRCLSISKLPPSDCATRLERQAESKHVQTAERFDTQCLLTPTSNAAWQLIEDEHFQYVPIPPQWDKQLLELQTRMGVRFRDLRHLKTALVHHGAIPQNQLPPHVPSQRLSNRSLEFLGDSVLGMAVASYVFQSQPRFQEGQLTQLKSMLVNNETLSKVAVHDLGLHELIVVPSELKLEELRDESRYQKGRVTIQAGAVEALIAAVYVDQVMSPTILLRIWR
jgi:hypothetical protein